MVAGVFALQISILFDFCDGEVSRYRQQQSKEGTYLDKIYHFLVHPSVFAGITIGAYQTHPSTWLVVVGFICTISTFVCPIVQYAKQFALWIHCRRLLDKLNKASQEGTDISNILTDESGEQTVRTDKHGFSSILKTWNFG